MTESAAAGKYVLTLITPPGSSALDDATLDTLQQTLTQAGAAIKKTRWLAPSVAYDLYFEDTSPRNVEEKTRELLTKKPVDIIVQATEHRKKRLLITDMDSTIIEQECIDELADFVGKKKEVAKITEAAMNGDLDFKAALEERVALLEGLTESTLEECYRERITFMPGARELVATMKENRAYCVLVSGGFTFFTSRIKVVLGFDQDSANTLLMEDGKLTGKVKQPVLDKEAKLRTLQTLSLNKQIDVNDILAAGDGANDIPMLQAAGLGVAFRAKPKTIEKASHHITHCDLIALLYAQGYTQEEVITP